MKVVLNLQNPEIKNAVEETLRCILNQGCYNVPNDNVQFLVSV